MNRTFALMTGAALACISAMPCAAAPEPQIAIVPCETVLPAGGVKTAPAPLDAYVTLICTAHGQAMRPKDGFKWVFEQGSMWLAAANKQNPQASDHYTELVNAPMSATELADFRKDLKTIYGSPDLQKREVLRIRVTTSGGIKKQLLLMPPQKSEPADHPAVGMECIHECKPIDKDPWLFTIEPTDQAFKGLKPRE